MGKKTFLFSILFLSLILIGSVSAQPPVFQQGTFDTGLTIEHTNIDFLKAGSTFNFHIHVFNTTSGTFMTNDTTTCFLHLYNASGNHLVQLDMNFDIPFDFEAVVLGDNFSLGQTSVLYLCNTSTQGGFLLNPLMVTTTGEALEESQSIIIVGLIIILLVLSLAFLIFGIVIPHTPTKIFLIGMGSLMMMFTIGFGLILINNLLTVGPVISGLFTGVYTLSLILISAGGIGLMLYIIVMAVRQFYEHRGLLDDMD